MLIVSDSGLSKPAPWINIPAKAEFSVISPPEILTVWSSVAPTLVT